MGGGLESRCVGRVYCADGAVQQSLVRPILEYGAACWDPYRECQINALDRVQKRAAKFAQNTGGLGWESLAQCRKIAHVCFVQSV